MHVCLFLPDSHLASLHIVYVSIKPRKIGNKATVDWLLFAMIMKYAHKLLAIFPCLKKMLFYCQINVII